MYILIAIVGLALLIIVHEAGHAWAARRLGVGIERFSLFFGPAILRKTIKGIDFRVGTIPLGGYVRLVGQHRADTSELRRLAYQEPKNYDLVRALDDLDNAQTFVEAEEALERIRPLAQAYGRQDKELERLATPLRKDAFWLARPRNRLLVLIAGPGVNLFFAVILMTLTFMIGGAGGRETTTLRSVEPHSAASISGLSAGDHILAVDGRSTSVTGLIQAINKGRPLTLIVQRDNRLVTIKGLRPQATVSGPKIGVYFAVHSVYYDPLTASIKGTKVLGRATYATGAIIVQAFRAGGTKDLTGPIGIVRISANTIQSDPRTYVGVLALVSLSLALLNILPIPPLDGGLIAITAIEAARRRRLSANVEIALTLIGFGLVLMMLMVGLQNDLHY